jgi:hypothetical protein
MATLEQKFSLCVRLVAALYPGYALNPARDNKQGKKEAAVEKSQNEVTSSAMDNSRGGAIPQSDIKGAFFSRYLVKLT